MTTRPPKLSLDKLKLQSLEGSGGTHPPDENLHKEPEKESHKSHHKHHHKHDKKPKETIPKLAIPALIDKPTEITKKPLTSFKININSPPNTEKHEKIDINSTSNKEKHDESDNKTSSKTHTKHKTKHIPNTPQTVTSSKKPFKLSLPLSPSTDPLHTVSPPSALLNLPPQLRRTGSSSSLSEGGDKRIRRCSTSDMDEGSCVPGEGGFDPKYAAAEENIQDDARRYRGVISQIIDGLYLTGEGGSQNAEELARLNIRRVLNLAEAVCVDAFPEKYAYFTIDLLDDGAKEDLRSLFLEVVDWLETPNPPSPTDGVLVHCHAGMSRSATFVIAYIMWKLKMGFREAIEFVTKKRSVVSPNGGFIGQLILWEKLLRASCDPRQKDDPTAAKPRLLRVVVHPRSYHMHILVGNEVRHPSSASLDTRGCFVLHIPSARTAYCWMGRHAATLLCEGGHNICRQLSDYLSVENVVTVREGEEPEEFWTALGEDAEQKRQRQQQEEEVRQEVRDLDAEYVRRVGGTFRYPSWDVVTGLIFGGLYTLECHAKRQVWVKLVSPSSIAVWVPPGFVLREAAHGLGPIVMDRQRIAEVVAEEFYRDMNIKYSKEYLHIVDSYASMLPDNTPRSYSSSP